MNVPVQRTPDRVVPPGVDYRGVAPAVTGSADVTAKLCQLRAMYPPIPRQVTR